MVHTIKQHMEITHMNNVLHGLNVKDKHWEAEQQLSLLWSIL